MDEKSEKIERGRVRNKNKNCRVVDGEIEQKKGKKERTKMVDRKETKGKKDKKIK